MNKTIYRVECAETHNGPYQSGRLPLKSWSKRCHGDFDTPTPGYDKKLSEYGEAHGWFDGKVHIGHFCFAFISMESLYGWFTSRELSKLKTHGFVVAAYQVVEESLIHGTHQVVFTRDQVLSRQVVNKLPRRTKVHPKENYDSEEAQKYTEEKSRWLMDLMLDRSMNSRSME